MLSKQKRNYLETRLGTLYSRLAMLEEQRDASPFGIALGPDLSIVQDKIKNIEAELKLQDDVSNASFPDGATHEQLLEKAKSFYRGLEERLAKMVKEVDANKIAITQFKKERQELREDITQKVNRIEELGQERDMLSAKVKELENLLDEKAGEQITRLAEQVQIIQASDSIGAGSNLQKIYELRRQDVEANLSEAFELVTDLERRMLLSENPRQTKSLNLQIEDVKKLIRRLEEELELS